MELFFQQLVNGLSLGSLYGLVAVGYTVVYGIIQLINFAHGEIFMIGAFGALAAWLLIPGDSLSLWMLPVMLLVGMAAAVGTSLLTERFAYRPLRNAPRLAPLITAIGVSVFLQEFIRLFFGRIPGFPDAKRAIVFPQIDYVTGLAIQLGPITVQRAALFTIIALVICWGFLYVFVNRTQVGRAMQATSQDPDTARLMGINVDRIIMVAFALGAAMAAVAGLCWGPALYQCRVQDGVRGRPQGVYGSRARRDRQHQWRRRGRPRARGYRGDGDHLYTWPVRWVGLEGRVGVRDTDPGLGLPATGPARREGGGSSMITMPRLITPERQQRSDPAAGWVGIAGGVVLAASAFLPWAYAFQALDGMSLFGYPSPLQILGMVLGLLVAGLIICSRRDQAERQDPGGLGTWCKGSRNRCPSLHDLGHRRDST